MKRIRIVPHAVYALGLLLIVLFGGNRYGWTSEMDPSIPANAIEVGSGNSAVFTGAALILILTVQLSLVVKIENKREKAGSAALILLALWLMRAN